MISIEKNTINEIVINKSRFITELIKIDNEDNVKTELQKIKNKYVGATHYCYAYICNNQKRFSDDKEPSKTAGMPILNVLENNKLNNILCVVIRYFGGIKLGTGGLVRAYTKAVTECLEKTTLVNLVPGKKIRITFSYSKAKIVYYLLTNINITDKNFQDDISYELLISDTKLKEIYNELLQNTTNIQEIEKILIEE